MYEYTKKIFFSFIIITTIMAQVSIEASPKSLLYNINDVVPKKIMPIIDQDLLLEQDLEESDKNIPLAIIVGVLMATTFLSHSHTFSFSSHERSCPRTC